MAERAEKLVPIGALHEERERRKVAEKNLQALMIGNLGASDIVSRSVLGEERHRRKEVEKKAQVLRNRVAFLEQIIAEYAKYTRRPGRNEWASITPRLRFAVLLRDNFQCTYYGLSAKDGATLTVDHLVPRSAGGRNVVSNLRTACLPYNQGKAATLIDLEGMVKPIRSVSADMGGPESGRIPDEGCGSPNSAAGSQPVKRPREAEPGKSGERG